MKLFRSTFLIFLTIPSLINCMALNKSVYANAHASMPSAAPSPEAKRITESVVSSAASPVLAKKAIKLTVDRSEVDNLLKKYGKPITIKGIQKIKAATLTKEALLHVFGMDIKKDAEGFSYLSGFHHDYKMQQEYRDRPFYFSGRNINGVFSRFFAFDRYDLPVFKTFFSPFLTREQVIEKLIESLKRVQNCTKQDTGNILIEGKTVNNMTIHTVINPKAKIITFYPVTEETDSEKEKAAKLQLLFKKFFHNVEKKPERKALAPGEAERLANHMLKEFKLIGF